MTYTVLNYCRLKVFQSHYNNNDNVFNNTFLIWRGDDFWLEYLRQSSAYVELFLSKLYNTSSVSSPTKKFS